MSLSLRQVAECSAVQQWKTDCLSHPATASTSEHPLPTVCRPNRTFYDKDPETVVWQLELVVRQIPKDQTRSLILKANLCG